MKYSMLSLLSIILVLSVKSLDISAKDYYELRVLANIIPPDPYAPHLFTNPLENKLDSIVFRIASNANESFSELSDNIYGNTSVFNDLQNEASEVQLNNLMTHPSPLVKVYAYRALIMNNMNMNCDYKLQLIEDTSCVEVISDGQIIRSTVQELVQADIQSFK